MILDFLVIKDTMQLSALFYLWKMFFCKILILFILWTVFGSFWWVLISREWDKRWIKSMLFWRSKCDKCWQTLSALELIPIVSFLVQKWKCKKCGTKLSNFYRIIELIMWITFVLTYCFFPYWDILGLVARLAINRWLVLLIIVDFTKYELHFPIWVITTIIAIIYSIIKNPIKNIIICALVFIVVFLWIYFLWKLLVKIKYKRNWEWFGQWDIYLAWIIWILFPFVFVNNDISFNNINIVYLLLFYIIISWIVWLIYVWIRCLVNKNTSNELPFIPAMILAFWILLLFGNTFINIM